MNIQNAVMRPQHQKNILISLINDAFQNRQNLIGLEIGSFKGQSAQIFISTNKFDKFICIDPWTTGYDNNDWASPICDQAEKYFDERFKDNKIIKKIKKFSIDAVNDIQDQSLDFIYIDGNHQYQNVKKDIELYFSKVKNDGIIAGHDFPWEGVKRALIEIFKKQPYKSYSEGSWFYYKNN